jgi:Cu/Ag efflux protein CusF
MKRLLGVLLLLAPLSAGAQSMSEGEVRKVDKDAGKLTLKHGPIPNLDMPPMTMVFRVNDAAMLDALKPGDKVNFQAEKQGGQYVVTKIVPAKIGGFLDAGQPALGGLREHSGGTFA